MNLHGIVAGAIGAINPIVLCTLQRYTGATVAADGTRVPSYDTVADQPCQIQSLTYGDLQMLDGLNVQGDKRGVYINGQWDGVSRPLAKGGDLLTMPDGSLWLVAQVVEDWPDWVKLAVTRQVAANTQPGPFILGKSELGGANVI